MRSCGEGGGKGKGRGLKRRGEGSRVPGNLELQLELFVGSDHNSKRYCEISSLSQVFMKTVTVKTPTVGENCIFKHDLGHKIDV